MTDIVLRTAAMRAGCDIPLDACAVEAYIPSVMRKPRDSRSATPSKPTVDERARIVVREADDADLDRFARDAERRAFNQVSLVA